MFLKKIFSNRIVYIRYRISYLILLLAMAASAPSCKKNNLDYGNPSAIQLFNAIDDGVRFRPNYSGDHPISYHSALNVLNKTFQKQYINYVTQSPQPLALYAANDTLEKDMPVLDINLNLTPGSVNSLFVFGNQSSVEYILNEDHYPVANPGDSLTFIRFVNLSADQAISVNLKDEPAGSVVNNLAYKGITDFENFPANSSVSTYEWEVRDQQTGDLLATYITSTINDYSFTNPWLNKPNTFVFTGHKNGTGVNAPQIVWMRHLF